MDLKNIVFDMLVEEVRNKKLLNSLLDKWKSENSNLKPEDVEFIMTQFMGGVTDRGDTIPAIKDKLNPKKPEVVSFLQRYDGEYGTDKFDPKNLKNIASYSYNQIKSLFLDFRVDLENTVPDEVPFFEEPGTTMEEKIAASRDLWMGNKHMVYDDGKGFRIYRPTNQKESIAFGYWQKHLKDGSGRYGAKWCITWNRNEGDGNNRWEPYRSQGRTYYFVIDENRDQTDPYFISVVQPTESNGQYPFMITRLNNDGDRNIKLVDNDYDTCLTCIYPQFQDPEVLEVLESVPYDPEKELNIKSEESDRVNEREGHRYEFRRVSRPLKLRFIQTGGVLSKLHSFQVMDEGLIVAYFESVNQDNVLDKFQSHEVFKFLTSKSSIRKLLQQRLSTIAEQNNIDPRRFGLGMIYTKLIESTFKTVFLSKQDSDIKIMESKENELIGILDSARGQWV